MSAIWDPTPPSTLISVPGGAADPTPPATAAPVPGVALAGTPWTVANYFKGGAILDEDGVTLGCGPIAASSWSVVDDELTLTVPDDDGSLEAEDDVVLLNRQGHKFTAVVVSTAGGGEDPYTIKVETLVSVAQGALTNPVPPTTPIDPEE
jgi:hypothetical protein